MNILCIDIGGRGYKYAWNNSLERGFIRVPLPNKNEVLHKQTLEYNMRSTFAGKKPDTVILLTTAVLMYPTLQSGVDAMLEVIEHVFPSVPLHMISRTGEILDPVHARQHAEDVACREYVGTAQYAIEKFGITDFLLIDIGTSSTSIIPVSSGKVNTVSTRISDALSTGELLWQGVVNTRVTNFLRTLIFEGKEFTVNGDSPIVTGEVYWQLSKIPTELYVSHRGPIHTERVWWLAANLLLRPLNEFSKEQALNVLQTIMEEQIRQIRENIQKVLTQRPCSSICVVGSGFAIGRIAAEGLGKLYSFEESEMNLYAPLYGSIALLEKEKV